jgi:hypothetical protein
MAMPPTIRKLSLAIHLTLSTGWIGAVVAYLVLSTAVMTTSDPTMLRGGWLAMDVVGWYAIVPLALGSLATGLVMALGTKWGLFRHYWVLISLLLTVFAVTILLLHMPDVSALADAARDAEASSVGGPDSHLYARLSHGDFLHPVLGLVVLVVVQVLNVYKPRGMTPYGWRKEEWRRGLAERAPGS